VYETYRIETLGTGTDGDGVIRRTFVRADSVEAIKDRAMKVFSRARRPQSRGPEVEAVRVLDGAGYEIFSVSIRD
jgi:hypothetical protein